MPNPNNHLFKVELRLEAVPETLNALTLVMPVWTPGSYLVREYSRHVQQVQAWCHGTAIAVEKVAKNRWHLEPDDPQDLSIVYYVLATDLTVRTNHLDQTHGYFNPAALLMTVEGYLDQPHAVTIEVPYDHWQIATALPQVSDDPPTFEAENYDILVDSPFEIGEQNRFDFVALEKPHSLVIWGKGNYDAQRLIQDIRRLIETEAKLFGTLPYDRYLFILHLSSHGYGGLEHRESCSLICPRSAFRNGESYTTVLNLIAHEFFHLWNVKRLRPLALETFDYEQENYTPSLWFSEGVTSYYDLLIPQRSGLYDAQTFLKLLSKDISRFFNTPGRLVHPLREASFDAWVKLYRRDAHSDNYQISYYLKGAMVAFILDLQIRARHHNQRSFDDVLRSLWQEFGPSETGFTEADLEHTIFQVLGSDEPSLREQYYAYLDGVTPLPFNDVLAPFGLQLVPMESALPFWGLNLTTKHGRTMIHSVLKDSPAEQAGLEPKDELLAMDDVRVNDAEHAIALLQNYEPQQTVTLSVFHQDLLCQRRVVLAPPQPTQYDIQPLPKHNAQQRSLCKGWLGQEPIPVA